MFGQSSKNLHQPITGINVTPLVDIVLVLLIIFMVTAKFVVSRAMPMDLPRAASGSAVQEIFSVELYANGKASVNGEPITQDADATRELDKLTVDKGELRAVVRADGTVQHQRVMQMLDLLRQAGVAHIAFAVTPQAAAQTAVTSEDTKPTPPGETAENH